MTRSGHKKREALAKLAEQYPWLAMYAASFKPVGNKGGRPSIVFPRSSFSLRLTNGESKVVDEWQAIFSRLLGKQPARGETVGLIAWLAMERYKAALERLDKPPEILEELLDVFKID